ncbi:hypothetical protein CN899_28285 [Bacillus thuringiensis]|uniref:Uncharacterized protein n=1 Tax=Bacillus thuringiensis TaxID=1428 RepID=A0A9X7GGD3_BACTU|nr:hypothetical protein [Bacillus thuringiensis]PFE82980.1 hypothetical protein CN320_22255 [Bacillus thuringiensis]PGH78612.1 hypothetical protein CN899_28285 [Bacillus thuringiensis]
MDKIQELELKIKELEEEIQWRDSHIETINKDNNRLLEQSMEVANLIDLYNQFIVEMDLGNELKVFIKEKQKLYN